eukprot:TRINITY_DN7289_c0_g1_i1.p1 TRINITY_DN7289_c0_g1~~TRINITY_DN7289_c0_g1_i1.p1  ORF type:complete len:111 (+),score=11.58 TRINITY_DN7289_c0_g1_i1:393-725(+)
MYSQHGRGRKSERRLKARLVVDCSGSEHLIANHLSLFEERKTSEHMESIAFMTYFREDSNKKIPIVDWNLPNGKYICFPEGYVLISPVNSYNKSNIRKKKKYRTRRGPLV